LQELCGCLCGLFVVVICTPMSMISVTDFRFYLWWIVLYWMWVFLCLGDYMKTRSFTTLYDRCPPHTYRRPPKSQLIHFCMQSGIQSTTPFIRQRPQSHVRQVPRPHQKNNLHGRSSRVRNVHHAARAVLLVFLVGSVRVYLPHDQHVVLQRQQLLPVYI
jgi:hypothetical protein